MKVQLKNYLPNLHTVTIDQKELYFSYSTVVAFYTPETGLVISENVWSTTTGKHLNYINDNKKIRIPHAEFLAQLEAL